MKAVETVSLMTSSSQRDLIKRFSFQHKDVTALEKAISNGQAEELILQAEKELILARKMLGWKPWESLVRQAPPTQWQWPPAERKQLN